MYLVIELVYLTNHSVYRVRFLAIVKRAIQKQRKHMGVSVEAR